MHEGFPKHLRVETCKNEIWERNRSKMRSDSKYVKYSEKKSRRLTLARAYSLPEAVDELPNLA